MKILYLAILLFTANAWATKPMDCGGISPIEGVAKIASFECDESGCGVRVIAPSEYDKKEFLGFTLIVGTPPEPDFSGQLEYVSHGGIVDVTVYGSQEKLTEYQVWAVYGGKGICPRHSVVNLVQQHNKAVNERLRLDR